jgi:hypothetical protein
MRANQPPRCLTLPEHYWFGDNFPLADLRLSVAEVKKVIVDGADAKDVSGGRMIRLLNEARSFELARAARP